MLPKFPKLEDFPTRKEATIDLIEAIVEEQLALSSILHSEADEISAFVEKVLACPSQTTNTVIINYSCSVNRIVHAVLMKEWLLLQKLEMAVQLQNTLKNCNCTDSKLKPKSPSISKNKSKE